MPDDFYPVRWDGTQAVVTLPEHMGASNAGQVRNALLSVINYGAATLIADMTATVSCDHAGADAVVRAWQRTVSSGTELRLVVTARSVSRVLGLRGLDRQVSVYPSLPAALDARLPAWATAGRRDGQSLNGGGAAAPPPGGALQDAVALADGDGVIAAVSARLEEMFGYGPGEVAGLPVKSLVPEGLLEARLAGLRKDGTTFPVEVGLTPVVTVSKQLTLAVIRDISEAGPAGDLAGPACPAAAQLAHLEQLDRLEHLQLLDEVISGLFAVALSLQAAASLPAAAAGQRTEAILDELDDIIRQLRDGAFHPPRLPPPDTSGDDQ